MQKGARSRLGVAKEFEGVSVGDERLDRRLLKIVARVEAGPAESFPKQMGSEAEQEATYRFFGNRRVTLEKVLAPHRQQTIERIRGRSTVRVLYDTSRFTFEGDREGLGILRGDLKGFFGHVGLVVAADESREPLGVLNALAFINKDTKQNRKLTQKEKSAAQRAKTREEKKSSRWENTAIEGSQLLPDGTRAVHVMDQEADDYDVFAGLKGAGLDFVIRGDPKRLTANGIPVEDELCAKAARVFRKVQLSVRTAKQASRQHPVRAQRDADLRVRWASVRFHRPESARAEVDELTLTVVHVFEPRPPKGEEPVSWLLLTTLPVSSVEEAILVVDHYRARWVIEEFFKALKTGCAFEKRQLCSLDALVRVFGVFVPIAWHLLALRNLGREDDKRPATHLFTREQLLLLGAMLGETNRSLPKRPSIREAMLGIAALGGHIKNNGDPGWLVLGRGLIRFTEAERVWQLCRKYDQS
jgi:hypothetical protein